MKEKLCKYAHSMLPGGQYWEPDPTIKAVLQQLKPSNDLCESILGLNDYLTTAIPNLHQLSRSNLIQVKKNKTMQWFEQLPKEKQDSIVELAIRRRAEVAKQYKKEEAIRSAQRREKMVCEKLQRDALEQRAKEERERLSNLHLIMTVTELKQALSEIDSQTLSSKKKCEMKHALIREQVNIRKKVLKQTVRLHLTHKGKKRPMRDIITDLSRVIEGNSDKAGLVGSSCECSAESLVGRDIFHRFDVEGEEKWYTGHVLSYNAITLLHEVVYEDEEENCCFFNLLEDFRNGDLILNN